MIEFDKATDPSGGTQGGPVVFTTELDEQISRKEGFVHSLAFSANNALADELGMKDHVILLKQIEMSTLILTWLALQKVPIWVVRADDWHAGKLCNDRKFMAGRSSIEG
jgi:hypothetical protein